MEVTLRSMFHSHVPCSIRMSHPLALICSGRLAFLGWSNYCMCTSARRCIVAFPTDSLRHVLVQPDTAPYCPSASHAAHQLLDAVSLQPPETVNASYLSSESSEHKASIRSERWTSKCRSGSRHGYSYGECRIWG